jgi:histidyl-tRNA synthetase
LTAVARVRLDPLRGFRDILPPESTKLSRLASMFMEIAELHGFDEVKPPTLERFEIFALKSGEEIRRSMYVFRDKAGREVALRPEATASVARIYLKHLRGKPKPLKLYYVINCFRYEEPQRARYREFWQAGVEIIGAPGIEADFEAIKLLISFYRKIGMLDRIYLKIGTTRLYRTIFSHYNVPEEIQDHVLHLMDKGLYDEALEFLRQKGHGELAEKLETIWNRRESIEQAASIASEITPEAQAAIKELAAIVDMIRQYEPRLDIRVDLSFARGLAYYTGIIYEVKVPGFPVSIAGGGRYDNLIKLYGEEDVPGTGFAIGLDRTLAAMEELGRDSSLLPSRPRAAIVVLSGSYMPYAAHVQDILIEQGITASILSQTTRLPKLIPKLAKQGYHYIVIIGEKEYNTKTVTIKDLRTKKQHTIPPSQLGEILQEASPSEQD